MRSPWKLAVLIFPGLLLETTLPVSRINPEFTVFQFLDNLTQLIAFNGTEGNPFTKPELRQAVAYALDTPAMCEVVSPGACLPAHTIGQHEFLRLPDKWNTEPYYDYDLAKAKELLAASGYEPGDLTVKLLGQTDPKSTLVAQVIQASLEDIGITVKIDQVEPAVFNQIQFDPTAFDMVISADRRRGFRLQPMVTIPMTRIATTVPPRTASRTTKCRQC